MKVPIMYKSSDRFNAGVDVIYDDESKLQYAPFVYATTGSGGEGGDDGGDEEGDETMVVKYDNENQRWDKTWQEVKDASLAGKIVVLIHDDSAEGADPYTVYSLYYLTELGFEDGDYYATFMGSYDKATIDGEPPVDIAHTIPIFLEASSSTDYLVYSVIG